MARTTPASGDTAAAALVAQVCSNCHDLTIVTEQRKTPADWADTVERMVGRGAPLTSDQSATVIAYLARTLPR